MKAPAYSRLEGTSGYTIGSRRERANLLGSLLLIIGLDLDWDLELGGWDIASPGVSNVGASGGRDSIGSHGRSDTTMQKASSASEH